MGDLTRWDYATYSGYVDWYEDQWQGDFVFYEEVKELQAELDELRKRPTCEEVEALRTELSVARAELMGYDDQIDRELNLQAQVKKWKERIASCESMYDLNELKAIHNLCNYKVEGEKS
jgi:hypothetical protein